MKERAVDYRLFACPIHKFPLSETLFCSSCAREYPAVNQVPVLINDANSVFRIEDYVSSRGYEGASSYAGHLDQRRGWRQRYRRTVSLLSEASPPRRDFGVIDAMARISASVPNPRVLVVGAGDSGISGDVVHTDVAFGANVQCIADAHDLPFVSQSFDACFAIAVLEHVADPYRCVQEISRVLKPSGYVYAETPFMQPVHMGAYDFTRFSYLGHRRLFRSFSEVAAGIVGGPGVSAGQMLNYAISSLSDRAAYRRWLKLIGLLLTYPLRSLDRLSYGNLSAYDSASGFYFFGQLSKEPISDRELITLFRGGR